MLGKYPLGGGCPPTPPTQSWESGNSPGTEEGLGVQGNHQLGRMALTQWDLARMTYRPR